MKHSARLLIFGDVQGVGYRYFAMSEARQLGLNGWVKNNSDGTVECEVEGEKEILERFIQILKNKHSWARIDSIEVTWNDKDSKYSNFFIK